MSVGAPLLALLIVGLLVALAVLLLRHAARKTLSEPGCGACDYPVRGLPSFTCPECGNDLRDVGINTPRQQRPLGLGAYLVGWTLLLPPSALIVTTLFAAFVVPQRVSWNKQVMLANPKSGAYAGFSITASGSGTRWPWADSPERPGLKTIDVNFLPHTGAGSTLTVEMDLPGFRYPDASGRSVRSSTEVAQSDILDWLTRGGVDISKPSIQTEASDLLWFIKALRDPNTPPITPSRALKVQNQGSGMSVGTHPVFAWSALGFWFVVWLLGVRYLVRRLRRPNARPPVS